MVNITGKLEKQVKTRIARDFIDYSMDDCASAIPNLTLAIREAVNREQQDVPWAIQAAEYARLVPTGPMEMINVDVYDYVHDTYTVRFNCYSEPSAEARTAWDNITDGKEFNGTAGDFYKALNDYGEIYATALISAFEAYEMEPVEFNFTVANVLSTAGYETDPSVLWWPTKPLRDYQFRNWYDLKEKCRQSGWLDSMLEAYEAGVPIEDILA